jgi:hypothetical protein
MANNFAQDPDILAYWRFENGALTADSKGSNTLTALNTPAADLADFKEGAACVDLVAASHQYFEIADGSLPAGWPFKNGDNTKIISLAFWFKPKSSVGGFYNLISKGNLNDVGWAINVNTGNLNMNVGGGGNVIAALSADIWYFLGIAFDGPNQAVNYYLFRASDNNLSTGTLTPDAVAATAANWRIGAFANQNTNYTANAKIDGLVVAKRLLTNDEFATIKDDTYPPPLQGNIPFTLVPDSQILIPLNGNIPLIISPTAVFPTSYEHQATGGVKVGGTADVTFLDPYAQEAGGGVKVAGDADLEFLDPFEPEATGGVVVEGKADIRFIPPDIAESYYVGGVKVAGEAEISFSTPITYVHEAMGGVVVGGAPELIFKIPEAFEHVAIGGVVVSGPFIPTYAFSYPADLTSIPTTLAVGLVIGGEADIVFDKPVYVTVDVTGAPVGLAVGGRSIVTFILPGSLEVMGEGEIIVGSDPPSIEDEMFDTWALNGYNYEPSIFTGYRFISYCKFRNQAYGAGADGIYLLEGPDDDGRRIRTGARMGPTNFGMLKDKRIRAIEGEGWGDRAKFKVSCNGENEAGGPDSLILSPDERDADRVTVPRELVADEFMIEIMDFDQLSHLEFTPLFLARK